ncbi:penicillin-binding protein 1A [Virgibacillus halotolerans]|uniref:transglycosylase domain-containing protein n=1 Tax=Virgibacillus halotolerans TaxID=1071053 RepID=UPI0019606325|nr:PBP1A family penicillin-binding protein [Virgibacillus halotolerans]MBM7599875.1 penicillin-binding protein 1A [Virgibacillus halotolerans]
MSNEYNSRKERRHRQKKAKSHGRKRHMWKKILLSLCAAFILVVITCGIIVAVMIHDAPTLKASDLQTPQSTRIYDQDDKLVSTLFHEENRIKVHIDEVPKSVKDAVISIEDKRFRHHHGIDIRRLFGAALSNIKNGWGTEGGSTITQQVIKRSVLTPEKTLTRKVQEAWLSLQLERKYSKDQILEMYLNNVYFGHGAYGIQTALETYFDDESLSELNVSQAALLAGLPNAPSANDPFKHPKRAKERRDLVLSAMVSNNVISKQQADQAKDQPISEILREEEKKQENNDPYNAFVDTVYEQLVNQEKVVSEKDFFQGGLKIYTTLDSKAQQTVYDLLQSKDIPYPDENFETGISLVDTKTGAVKAVGGGRNFKSIQDYNYGSDIQHHPGSTIKPILDYGPAIEYLNWSTSHTISDEHYQYSDGTPINEWDGKYWGDISIRRALEWSRNIPALKAFQAVGKDKAQKFASGLGIDIDPIYESAAIGGFDGVSPLQMAEAYAAFGNGGTYNEPFTVKKITFPDGSKWEPKLKSHEAMHDYTAYMITDMLKTVIASGTGTQANIDGIPVAGKTGSTNIPQEDQDQYGIGDGLRDAWFAGYTPQYSLAVWTGYPSLKNKDGDIQYIRYDGTQDIAIQLFQQLMSEISDPDMDDFEKPDSVITAGSELYVKGAQQDKPNEEKSDQGKDKENEEKQDVEQPEHEENKEDEKQDEEQTDQEEDKKQEDKQDEEQSDQEEDEKQEDKQDEEQTDQEEDKKQEDKQDEEQSDQEENEKQEDKQEDKQDEEQSDQEEEEKQEDKQDEEQSDRGKDTENEKQKDEQDKEKSNQDSDEQKDKKDDHSNDNEHNSKDKKNDNDSGRDSATIIPRKKTIIDHYLYG